MVAIVVQQTRYKRFERIFSNRFVCLSTTETLHNIQSHVSFCLCIKSVSFLFIFSLPFLCRFFSSLGRVARYSLRGCTGTQNRHFILPFSTLRIAHSFIHIIPVCWRLCVWHGTTRHRAIAYRFDIIRWFSFVEVIDETLIHWMRRMSLVVVFGFALQIFHWKCAI